MPWLEDDPGGEHSSILSGFSESTGGEDPGYSGWGFCSLCPDADEAGIG